MKDKLIFLLYNLAVSFILPVVLIIQTVKDLKTHKLSRSIANWKMRLAGYGKSKEAVIWIHLASVGETIAAGDLVHQLAEKSQYKLLITNNTATGYNTTARIFAGLIKQERLMHTLTPYDTYLVMQRFFLSFDIKLVLVMEAEIWPNLLRRAKKLNIPSVLINARLSAPALRRRYILRHIVASYINLFSIICTQSAKDQKRFEYCGISNKKIINSGNLKFGVQLDEQELTLGKLIKSQLGRPTILAASTHEGEEELTLHVFTKILAKIPNSLLVIVPRHPHRALSVGYMCKKKQLNYAFYREGQKIEPETQVLIIDTIGQLIRFYAMSDIAFVGGSLVAKGGHNILEPAIAGCAIITGNHYFNNSYITKVFLDNDAARLVHSADGLYDIMYYLLTHPQQRNIMLHQARSIVKSNQGAVANVLAVVRQYL